MSRSNVRRISIWSYGAYVAICLVVLVLSSCQSSQHVSLDCFGGGESPGRAR